DAALVSRVQAGNDTGYAAYQTLDPIIVEGVDGNTSVTTGDVNLVNRVAAGLTTAPQIPTVPGLTITSTGPDPSLSIPADVQVLPDGTLRVPVDIDDPRPAGSSGLTEATLALTYDPRTYSASAADVQLGSVPLSGNGWRVTAQVNAATGQIGIELFSTTP